MTNKTFLLLAAFATWAGFAATPLEEFRAARDEIARLPGLVRYYTFEEGKWFSVENRAPVPSGESSFDGGPLGSFSIKSQTPYGVDYDAYDPIRSNPPGVDQPRWTRGRVPGKSALYVGTRRDTTYRSGVTGDEFQKGWTFVTWARVASGKPGLADLVSLGDAWNCGFRLSAGRWHANDAKGAVTLRLALPAKAGEAGRRLLDCGATGFSGADWHCVAATWDGDALRLYVDGALGFATNGVAETFAPLKFPNTWCGTSPFYEECIRDPFRLGGSGAKLPGATIDELALFSRALTADELALFRRVPGVVPPPEPTGVALAIPKDSNGYFRIDETVPATCDATAFAALAPGMKLRASVETLAGRPVATRETPLADGRAKIDLTFPACGVYYVDLALVDAKGAVVKGLDEPYPVGVVPPAPKTLDSPFALWATQDPFHYDMNRRRIILYYPWEEEDKGTFTDEKWEAHWMAKSVRRDIARFRDEQKLGDQVCVFSCLGLRSRWKTPYTDAQKEVFRRGFERQVKLLKSEGVREFEVSSEVNNQLAAEGYVEQLKILVPIIRREIPGAKIYPPGATPNAVPYIDRLLKLGAGELIDGVSIHPYSARPLREYHQGESICQQLRKVCAEHPVDGRPLLVYNTESGVFCLRRVAGRPMTREQASRIRLSRVETAFGPGWVTSMLTLPEDESAVLQCTLAMIDLASGFRTYCKCQHGSRGAVPCLQGVAMTALSGQVLNHMKGQPRMLSLPALTAGAIVFDRPGERERFVLAAFADEPARLSFRVAPGAAFRTMDLYGNFAETKADARGVLVVDVTPLRPVYVFGVPGDVEAVAPVRLELPEALSDDGVAEGKVVLENPFDATLTGRLAVTAPADCRAELPADPVSLAPGERKSLPLRLVGRGLRRGSHELRVDFGGVASASRTFQSKGQRRAVACVAAADLPPDGDEAKWRAIEAERAKDAENVAIGKPNLAEPWVKQWRNADDLSFTLRLAYARGDAIRFLLSVTDDRIVTVPESNLSRPFFYDCVELFVDTRAGRELGATVDVGADQVIVVPGAGDAAAPCDVQYPKGEARRIDVACVGRRTAKGYVVEGEIRPRAGSAFRVLPGSQFRMDVMVDDCDEVEKPRKSAMALHGGSENAWNAAGWGRYELDAPAEAGGAAK